jgi:FkbM family methyltransferase
MVLHCVTLTAQFTFLIANYLLRIKMSTQTFDTSSTTTTLTSQLLLPLFQEVASRVVPRGLPRIGWISRRLLLGSGVREVNFRQRFSICCNTDSYHEVMFAYGIENRHIDHLLAKILKQGDVFIDIGAHIGMVTLMACSTAKNIKAHCFEPDPRTFAWLAKNVSLNPFDITLNSTALGASNGKARLTVSTVPGWSTLIDEPEGGFVFLTKDWTETVEVVSLDDYCTTKDIKPNLIKIDVEGFEYQVLQGAQTTLAKAKPFIIIEINPTRLAVGGSSNQEIIEFLQNLGYSLFHVDPTKVKRSERRSSWGGLPEVYASDVPINKHVDAIAVPASKL